jgi:hypothetical protein
MFYVYYAISGGMPLYSQPRNIVQPWPKLASREASNFHQIFLTASPIFCMRIQAYFKGLLESVTRGAMEYPHSDFVLQTIGQKVDEFIERLDISKAADVTNINVPSFSGDDPRFSTSHVEQTSILIEEDMENKLLSSVPDSLFDLKDEHFPLFLTYRKFTDMIHKAFVIDLERKKPKKRLLEMSQSELDMSNEIDYPTFVHKYWNHLDVKLTNKMDSSLAYNEIMGIIKGSESAAKSSDGFLTREQYLCLSERSYGSLKGVRQRVYDIFLAYQKMKTGEKDALDRFVPTLSRCRPCFL